MTNSFIIQQIPSVHNLSHGFIAMFIVVTISNLMRYFSLIYSYLSAKFHCHWCNRAIFQCQWSSLGVWLIRDTNTLLWPRNTMWQHRSGATLAQVMACCLTAPSHYLTQCWLIISKVQWHSSESNFKEIHQLSTTKINLKITHRKFRSNLPGPKDLNWANRATFIQFLGYELHLCVLPCF